jgi:vacuolar-type H+-ATPase subunit H
MTIERRTQALLDLVDEHRRTQVDAIVAAAREQAAALLAQARAEARQQVRDLFAEERERAAAKVAAAQARLQTQRRLHQQRQASAWLALAWRRLPQALRERWNDPLGRRQWVQMALARAGEVLQPGRWQFDYAPDWPADERQALVQHLAAESGIVAECSADASLGAGLRIVAAGNVVDATLAGLTADRSEIGARLLVEPEAAA